MANSMILDNVTFDLSGSGTTAQWATAVVALLAFLAASLFAHHQIAIMKKQQTIIENQEQRQKKANLVANFRKIRNLHPTAPEATLPDSGLSALELEIRNIGPAEARKIRATLIGVGPKDVLSASNLVFPDADIMTVGDRRTRKFNAKFWQQVVITMDWEDNSGEGRQYHKTIDVESIGESF